jgi:hypothetical protein
VAISV